MVRWRRWLSLAAPLLLCAGVSFTCGSCTRKGQGQGQGDDRAPAEVASLELTPLAVPRTAPGPGRVAARENTPIRPLRRCFPDLAAWEDPQVADLLDRAAAYHDE